jgi:hypothetical protein
MRPNFRFPVNTVTDNSRATTLASTIIIQYIEHDWVFFYCRNLPGVPALFPPAVVPPCTPKKTEIRRKTI